MKYIYKSLDFSQQNLGLLALFIIINLTPILISTSPETDKNFDILYSLLPLVAYIFSFLLLSGSYSIIWKKFKNEPINFSLLISESKRYFCNLIGVTIVIAILGLIIAVVFDSIYKHIFYKNVESVSFYTTSEFVIIVSISFHLMLAIYCYAIPYLYVKRLNSKRAILSAPKIFIKHMNRSVPIIILLFINLLITFLYPEIKLSRGNWQLL